MSSGGSLKYSLPPGVQQSLSQSNAILQQELQRLQGLQGALTGNLPAQYAAMGFNPATNQPYVQSMLNTLLGGGQINPGDYTMASTRGPGPMAPNPGPRPIDYRTEFAQKGYKNWGKNDIAAEQQRNTEIAAWEQQNAAYQQSLAQWNALGQNQGPIQNFDLYRAQAQQQADLFRRAGDTTGIQSLLSSLQGELGSTPTGWTDALSNLGTYEQQLQQALNNPDAEWQQQYDTSQQQAIEYQSYLERVLKGDEPIDPAIGRLAQEKENETRARLYQQLGPGWETSSAGSEWMARLQKATEESQFAERQRMLTQGLSNYQGAIGATNALQQQRNDIINQALSRYTQGIQNLGTLGDIRQSEIASTLGSLNALYANQYNAMQAFSGNQSNQFNYGQSLAGALGGLVSTPFSQSLMPLVQAYQQQAQAYGQNAVARQPNPSLLQQISPILGMAAGAGLGAFTGGVGSALGAGVGNWLTGMGGGGAGGGGGGYNYQLGQPQWNWMT